MLIHCATMVDSLPKYVKGIQGSLQVQIASRKQQWSEYL